MGKQATAGWVVMKFGGTSVSSAANWGTICAQAGAAVDAGRRVLVVVSALSGVTNQLQRLAEAPAGDRGVILDQIADQHRQLLEELGLPAGAHFEAAWQSLLAAASAPEGTDQDARLAAIQSHGELLSSAIGAQVLARTGHPAHLHPATEILQATGRPGSHVLAAHCEAEPDAALQARLTGLGPLHITQGFLAGGPDGRTWLLGRGGSDTSAALLAARLEARELQIWTDVPGMFSADPRIVSDARLLRQLSYGEAQEFASMGAKVLHPPCIDPVRRLRIPLTIRDTGRPGAEHTEIGPRSAATDGLVKGIVARHDITLVHMETPAMWQQAGFLADAFDVFKRHGISIDLISTSESGVTISLDPGRRGSSLEQALERGLRELAGLCRVELRRGCVSISLVGNAIRAILSRLSEALTLFQDRSIHMVTQSSNDLNLTLVVDAEQADRLVQKLHQKLVSPVADHRPEFGPSWTAMTLPAEASPPAWWERRRKELLACLDGRDAVYAYDLGTVRAAARRLLALRSIARVLYAVKANHNPEILRALAEEGVGFECVSPGEIRHVLDMVPGVAPADVLYTPNFAARADYAAGLEAGVQLTIDNLHPLRQWPELFRGHEVFLRLDLDAGFGHHRKVITMGSSSKFGIPLAQLEEVRDILAAEDIRATGLHAHTGSGVGEPEVWQLQLQRFLEVLPAFPEVRVIDLGGGLGVPERRDQAPFELGRLDGLLAETLGAAEVDLWLEPGRYLVAEAGVLLSRVNQVKRKGEQQYLGIGTGMNSLIRPALYGAYHDIFNLSRLGRPSTQRYTVVGPICETGDVLGENRFLPRSVEGDVILVANAGAYGRVMSSNYNLRQPAQEVVLDA